MRPRIVLHPAYPPGVDTALAAILDVELLRPRDDAAVTQELTEGGEVLVTYTWREEFLTPSLRWIAGTGAGVEQYPLERLAERNVVLTTAAGVHAACVAEHAFALMLACTRRLGEAVRHMTDRNWQRLVGEEVTGKKLVIVGLGRIGEEFARRTQGWGMSVAGIKRSPAGYDGCLNDVRGPGELHALCEWADIVMLMAPATPHTRHLIGAPELELLGDGWLVNVGRGSLVDEPALVQALTNGRLRGAGLDVTAAEPLDPGSPLWSLPGVVLSAHNAGDSPGYGPRWAALFRDNLQAFAGGAEWRSRVPAPERGLP